MQSEKTLRSALGKVRGHGSARYGTEHVAAMKITSLALIILGLWFVGSLFACLLGGQYQDAVEWLRRPWNTGLMILTLAVGFYHAMLGLQTVIEDYVHHEAMKCGLLIGIKFAGIALALLGILITLKIFLS
jgi:succinate dehydrogenase / fumarate reductase, membrane anchor subunit